MRYGSFKSLNLPIFVLFADSSDGVAEPSKTVAPEMNPR